jgi:rubrerythrin
MTHEERASAVLELAIRESVKGHKAASGPLIRERVESCLSTALARCKEDMSEMYQMIDSVRELPNGDSDDG